MRLKSGYGFKTGIINKSGAGKITGFKFKTGIINNSGVGNIAG